jgi:dTDP-4-dehydrorhamnose reductase
MHMWGGIECTVNRVGNTYHTQLDRSGHDTRESDLDRCAALGIRALRYPLLWERTAPNKPYELDWRWLDQRLYKLRSLDIEVIAGLLHHGSGPRYTSLVNPDFATQFAQFAGCVAQRYPWINRYTPVNEPLTTARFSGLYGLWYPHGLDERTFKIALLNQCRATVLGMRAIRSVNPGAQLVQTEDLGKTYSTSAMAYQADFNNEMRWLAWDLLFGRVNRGHPLWEWLTHCCSATESELMWFADNPCPPNLIGVNHYITSERFLDEQVDNYPLRFHGGNGRQVYADIEAARCLATPTGGLAPLLKEVWARYRTPLAITEVHIDASREDQLRWLHSIWTTCAAAKGQGIEIEAVTAWALFGSFDWNCLLTQCHGYYEEGAFDVRGAQIRQTAIASLVSQLSSGQKADHPVLNQPGWWWRADRFFCHPTEAVQLALSHLQPAETLAKQHSVSLPPPRPVLICGATGSLGRAFARLCQRRGLEFVLMSRQDMDIANPQSVFNALEQLQPWAVINAAGYVRVDEAESDADRCFRENTLGPEVLASACAQRSIALVIFSSDLVFDGYSTQPYIETDLPGPVNIYGRSKAEAESKVLAAHPMPLIVRSSAFFGPWDRHNFVNTTLDALALGKPLRVANDIVVSPTYIPDLVNATLDLLIDGATGIWHLTSGGALTWAQLATKAAEVAKCDVSLIQPCSNDSFQRPARRPAYSALASHRGFMMPTLDNAFERFRAESLS